MAHTYLLSIMVEEGEKTIFEGWSKDKSQEEMNGVFDLSKRFGSCGCGFVTVSFGKPESFFCQTTPSPLSLNSSFYL